MGKPHKHAEMIKAWADGAEIQYKVGSICETKTGEWQDIKGHPIWHEYGIYRIKPEPKPDVVRYVMLNEGSGYASLQAFCNAVITIDGETGKLKSVEVLK